MFDAVEPKVCELLGTDPRMPATPIAERIGWTYSVRLLRIPVRELRDAACVGPIYFAGVEAGNA